MSKFKKWLKQELPAQRYNVSLDGKHFILGFKLKYKDGDKYRKFDTKGMSAHLETGATINTYVSKGAVAGGAVAGAVLFGPIGLLAGGLLGSAKRKGGGSIFVVVEQDGQLAGTIEVPASKEGEARKFIEVLNASANDPENDSERP
ncbi:hypothetical protein [Glutamicibacter sp. TV12E]|uniref:hypothetical protein n=1 Tax=Glutamicibacter sp. TV12E TaxID=3446362 RepID=UPI00403450EC